ncbi:head-tail adaptor protein [Rubrimonas cliftonensis]|uniref:Head-tail adaptor n=1 Tax=Rubrimonas cliftonensis TaxID=89524 RepID=A0A1H3ZHI2_9RHOB|nr:head-tail adaptor protein [Rubrimonas cliftonensis]SEA23117.1 head-tail adaptor [Rubrimonas cliftonensis]
MKSPLLNRLLTLEAPTRAEDGAGGATLGWTPLGAHWAELRSTSAREGVAGGVEASAVTHRATLRWAPFDAPSRPTAQQRFREGRRVFDILGVTEADPRNAHLHVWLREGAPL